MTGEDKEAKEAYEMLEEIHENVVSGDFSPPNAPEDMPRWVPKRGTVVRRVLSTVANDSPIKSKGIMEKIGEGNVTRVLTNLWHCGYVNRRGPGGDYTYTGVTNWGREALDKATGEPEQEELNSESDSKQIPDWKKSSLGRRQYEVLEAISELDGHPNSKELGAHLGLEPSHVSPSLTHLYENGLVERPDAQPYVYWITDKGWEELTN